MLLPRLRQRMLHIGHNAPAHVAANTRYQEEHAPPGQEVDLEAHDTNRRDDGPNPPWMWNTFYVSSVELGLLTESQARNFNLVVPTNSDSFSTVDITKSFVSVCNNIRSGVARSLHPTSLPPASSTYIDGPVAATERPMYNGMDVLAEAVLKPYVTCLDGNTVGRFNASTLVSLLKCLHELPIGETTGSALGLKNFLIGHLVTYSLDDLCTLEISEVLLVISKMGKSSSHCNPDAVLLFLKYLKGHPEVAGPTSAALSRFSHHFQLPLECEEYFEYAHAQAMK